MFYFHLLIKIIKLQIEYNDPVTRFFLAILIFVLWYGLYRLNIKNKKKVTIADYEVKSKSLLLVILSSFFLIYVLGFMYIRLLNISKTFNFYDVLHHNIVLLKSASYFSIFATICLIISTLLLIILIINWYKRLLLIYYLQLHFLIISYYPDYGKPTKNPPVDWFDDEKPYESLRWLFDRLLQTPRMKIYDFLMKYEVILTEKFIEWVFAKYKLYGTFILIILFFYDLIINQGHITKVFYFAPVAFLYYLCCKWSDVLCLYTQPEEIWITTFLYANIIFTPDTNFMYHDNGIHIPTDDLQELLEVTIPSNHN